MTLDSRGGGELTLHPVAVPKPDQLAKFLIRRDVAQEFVVRPEVDSPHARPCRKGH